MNLKISHFIFSLLFITSLYAQSTPDSFPYPTLPTELRTPTERAHYLVHHYWDHFDFSDSIFKYKPSYVEQAWVDFLDLLPLVSLKDAQNSIKRTFQQTEINEAALKHFMKLAEKYLYNLDSPLKNEEYYLAALEVIINSPTLSKIDKIKPQQQWSIIQKNQFNTTATDIFYQTAKDSIGTLHQIESPYILLFIHDFDCHTCLEELNKIRNSSFLQQLIEDKELTILTLYPYEQIEEWKSKQELYDSQWINGYDSKQEIIEKELYALRSSSALYLLDNNKKVLLKDCSLVEVENNLKQANE
ncbi:MAG: DUF5106 domain-containing protein [Bacteroidales bacterium]|nr:DUF5106 domain-containing protein [Bacteroidales bacterium]